MSARIFIIMVIVGYIVIDMSSLVIGIHVKYFKR
jgi:hypothetical protein